MRSSLEHSVSSDSFFNALQDLFSSHTKKDLFSSLRNKAWDRFLEINLPKRKTESFQYVPLAKLYAHEFAIVERQELLKSQVESFILPECKHSHLVFVNGLYEPLLSDFSSLQDQIIVQNFEKAMESYGVFIQNRLSRVIKEEQDPFAILNLCFQKEGVFIFVPAGTKLIKPLQIIFVSQSDGAKPEFFAPRVQLLLGKASSLTAVTTYISKPSDQIEWYNASLDIVLEEESQLKLSEMISVKSMNWHFGSMRATLKKSAHLKTSLFTTGAKSVRKNYHVSLEGENSHAKLHGSWVLKKEDQAHVHTVVDHQAPYTESDQLFKGIVQQKSKSSFEGKILVRSEAQKTQSYQLNRNLLLDDGAYVYSKPNLEIFADDVKASHGATMTQIASEDLFYFKTRGISSITARKMLTEGFYKEIVDQEEIPSFRKNTTNKFQEVLHES